MQFTDLAYCATDIINWAADNEATITFHCDSSEACRKNEHGLAIYTLEGTMIASKGDWIIKGVSGEFYPCKPDIFDKTYEAAE